MGTRKRKVFIPPKKTAPKPQPGVENAGRPGATSINLGALEGRSGFAVGDKVRILGTAPDSLRHWAHERGITVDDNPLCGHGRIELVRWLREQSVSETRHRYGNLRPAATIAVPSTGVRAVS